MDALGLQDAVEGNQLHSWRDWYRFARERLGYEAQEATEYANRRYAEELNRAAHSERL